MRCCRQYGFGCDNVVNFEVVLANATIVNANATSNTDLFVALKGGGNQFGTRLKSRYFCKADKMNRHGHQVHPSHRTNRTGRLLFLWNHLHCADGLTGMGRHEVLRRFEYTCDHQCNCRFHLEPTRSQSSAYSHCGIYSHQESRTSGRLLLLRRTDTTAWCVRCFQCAEAGDRYRQDPILFRPGKCGRKTAQFNKPSVVP